MPMNIDLYSKKISILLCELAELACEQGICDVRNKIYAVNRAIDVCGMSNLIDMDEISESDFTQNISIHNNIQKILDLVISYGVIKEDNDTYRDLFTAKLMDCFTMLPSELESKFKKIYAEDAVKATDFLYEFSQSTQYIRMDRVAKNRKWKTDTDYGEIDITINLSKPEKDPKAIAALANRRSKSYPLCLLCKENEGYAGGIHHPARHNHRVIQIDLLGETWYMQYSPYVYYNEHCIVFKEAHEPMKITYKTFQRLFEFVSLFPHYFIGSNADLPIVGGSILSHDHFQGGRYSFAMDSAKVLCSFEMRDYEGVQLEHLLWPLSVIRLKSYNRHVLADAANHVFEIWREYEDLELGILPYSHGDSHKKLSDGLSIKFSDKLIRHNTVTPIARRVGNAYELDIVLRNNRTDAQHPLGIFHPHSDVHNIKKENIGLIEVLGLAVLPARLQTELEILAQHWVDYQNQKGSSYPESIKHHKDWFKNFSQASKPNTIEHARELLQREVSDTFIKVLEYAGVFKQTEFGQNGMRKFLNKFM